MGGFGGARNDFIRSAELYGIWGYLALSDVVARYRNTILGPIWNSAYLIGQAVAMSFVFGAIFGSDVTQILPYILAGLIGWMFIPATILESSSLLLSSSGMIKGQTLPFMSYPLRAAMRSIIFLLHNVVSFAKAATVPPDFARLNRSWRFDDRTLGASDLHGGSEVSRHHSTCDQFFTDLVLPHTSLLAARKRAWRKTRAFRLQPALLCDQHHSRTAVVQLANAAGLGGYSGLLRCRLDPGVCVSGALSVANSLLGLAVSLERATF